MNTPLAPFLLPEGYAVPPVRALLREVTVLPEAGRYVARRVRPAASADEHVEEPVLLIPGFLAGDYSLAPIARHLRAAGFRTYRSSITANVSCAQRTGEMLERRLEDVAERRGTRVRLVGHSLGGMLARGLAVRRPELVSGIVTMGSPMLAPAAHHRLLTRHVELLILLARLGVPALMSRDCVGGSCAWESWNELAQPFPEGVGFTAIYSRSDGICDWRACIDPAADAVQVTTSHLGMAVDPRVAELVETSLRRQVADSAPAAGVSGMGA
jgi:pimeloyl-ACP methyl ester carboxylesterase